MPRLLLVTPLFPRDSQDPAVPFIAQFCQNLATERQVDVDVISLMYPFDAAPYAMGPVRVFPVGGRFRRSFKKLPMLLRAIALGIRLARHHQYDGILCFWYREAALVGRLLGFWSGVRPHVWMHGQDINKDNHYVKWLRILPGQILMTSARQRDLFFENHRVFVPAVADVCVDTKRFGDLNTGPRSIDILGVGNLGALKNYGQFLDVAALVLKSVPGLRIVICGDGEQRGLLQEKARKLGIEHCVRFTGRLPHDQVLNLMSDAKVLLHTSTFEGGSTVVQEALYSGCRVVSTLPIAAEVDIPEFYHATNSRELSEKLTAALLDTSMPVRRQPFSMETTMDKVLEVVYRRD